MSLDELNERIKEEVVLREGDLFEWQWRQMGLVAEAEALGVPAGDFLGLVNNVSRAINPYFGRISDLKIKVADLARLQRKKLTDPQMGQIVADAERLQLPPDFVKSRWIPAILATIPEPVESPNPPVTVAPVVLPTPEPIPAPIAATVPVSPVSPATPPPVPISVNGVDRDAVMRKVHQFLDEYVSDKHIPIRVLKPLFLATNFDETVLAEAVLGYLSANFYAAETSVQGETLKANLLSTDWRHLSWWGQASATPVAAVPPSSAARRGSSDSSVIGMALVAVGLMIGAVWWATRDKPAQVLKTPASVQAADSVPATRSKKKSTRRKPRTQPRPKRDASVE